MDKDHTDRQSHEHSAPLLTLGEIQKMSNYELRAKVGKLCGATPRTTYMVSNNGNSGCMFTGSRHEAQEWLDKTRSEFPNGWVDETYSVMPIENWPNYPCDLNACHEMEKHVPLEYWKELGDVTGYGVMSITVQNLRLISHATARQRCEAFVRTLQGNSGSGKCA